MSIAIGVYSYHKHFITIMKGEICHLPTMKNIIPKLNISILIFVNTLQKQIETDNIVKRGFIVSFLMIH